MVLEVTVGGMEDGLQHSLKSVSLWASFSAIVDSLLFRTVNQGRDRRSWQHSACPSEVSGSCDSALGDIHNQSLGLRAGATTLSLRTMDRAQGFLQI